MQCNREQGEPVLRKTCDKPLPSRQAPDCPCSETASEQNQPALSA
ncbi:hypothetical protein SAMN04488509_103146 [Aquimonas voraii]|uniref:Uncharacterized protein n=1 Tax=Aquimonas voraii TaxID=265719 RepID=A0A1G6VN41_9GAMM|nr:hypothetical protein SAMN04488509_103146 [Aquimonas voraii]